MLSQPFTFICMLLVLGGSVLQAQVKIYGMTTQGGGPDAGTLYSVNLDGTNYQQLYTFQGQPDGSHPFGGLTMAGDSKLYGVTGQGGVSNAGTIFSYDTATQTYQKLADFTGANGSSPLGAPLSVESARRHSQHVADGHIRRGNQSRIRTPCLQFPVQRQDPPGAGDFGSRAPRPHGRASGFGCFLDGRASRGGS